MVRAAPAMRGGHRNAGTASPAACAAPPRRRAASAKRNAGRVSTSHSIALGCDTQTVMQVFRRGPYDRDIVRLAVPALGALAAEPLYLLADTAMVGHLGTDELAALAIAATLLAGAFTLFNFLTYGTTAQVARLHGASQEVAAGRIAAQALWLSAGIGVVLTGLLAGLAVPLVQLIGGEGRVGDLAVLYCASA